MGVAARVGAAATRYGGVLALAVLVAWAAFFYRDILFTGQVYVFRDSHAFILPMHHAAHLLDAWGWPPLWNPLQVLGKPFAADIQNTVYYPLSWLSRSLPEPLGFNLNLALHHVIAAAGMFLLLRRWRADRLASAAGALLFAFGGLMIAFDNMANALQSSAWAPWAILAFDLWLERPTVARLAALATAISLTVLGAMPEVAFFENAAFAAMAWERRRNGGAALLRNLGAIAAANLLALGLCAAQIVPFFEYVGLSSRAGGLRLETATRFSFEPSSLPSFVLPRRLVDPSGRFSETATAWESDVHLPWAITLYLGVALLLVPFAWPAATAARRRLWLLFVGAFFALSFGRGLPGYVAVLEAIPALRGIRYPEKFLLVVHFGAAVAAAFGLQHCLRRAAASRRLAAAAVAVAVAAGAIGALLIWSASLPTDFARRVWGGDALALAGLTLAVGGVAWLATRQPRAAGCALIALIAFDLYRATSGLLPTLPRSFFATPPRAGAAMRRDESPLRIYSNSSGRIAVPIFPESVIQEHNLLLAEQATFHGIANLYAPASINLGDHEKLEKLLTSSRRDRVSRLLAFFNTPYLTSQRPLPYPGLARIQEPRNALEANLYAVEDVLPRAHVARELAAFADEDAVVAHLHEADDPAHRVAVIDPAPAARAEGPARGSARLASYLPDRVEVEASMQTAGLLVLSDTYYPGWRATVDGRPADIVRANYFARGVFLEPGEHRVVFEYRPASHRIGVAVSLLTAFSLLALIAYKRETPR